MVASILTDVNIYKYKYLRELCLGLCDSFWAPVLPGAERYAYQVSGELFVWRPLVCPAVGKTCGCARSCKIGCRIWTRIAVVLGLRGILRPVFWAACFPRCFYLRFFEMELSARPGLFLQTSQVRNSGPILRRGFAKPGTNEKIAPGLWACRSIVARDIPGNWSAMALRYPFVAVRGSNVSGESDLVGCLRARLSAMDTGDESPMLRRMFGVEARLQA